MTALFEENPVHLMPSSVVPGDEDLSIVVPAMNEELTVGEFVDWCRQGLTEAGVRGQILIVDSSTDRTPDIALEHGAEVLRTPPAASGARISTQFLSFAAGGLSWGMRI